MNDSDQKTEETKKENIFKDFNPIGESNRNRDPI